MLPRPHVGGALVLEVHHIERAYRHPPSYTANPLLALIGRAFGIEHIFVHSTCPVTARTCSFRCSPYGCNVIFRDLVLRRNRRGHVSVISALAFCF